MFNRTEHACSALTGEQRLKPVSGIMAQARNGRETRSGMRRPAPRTFIRSVPETPPAHLPPNPPPISSSAFSLGRRCNCRAIKTRPVMKNLALLLKHSAFISRVACVTRRSASRSVGGSGDNKGLRGRAEGRQQSVIGESELSLIPVGCPTCSPNLLFFLSLSLSKLHSEVL